MSLPKGSKIELQASYDNSSQNPRNPNNPPQTVHWGENTSDEMCIAFIQVETRDPEDRWTVLMALANQLDLRRYRKERNGSFLATEGMIFYIGGMCALHSIVRSFNAGIRISLHLPVDPR